MRGFLGRTTASRRVLVLRLRRARPFRGLPRRWGVEHFAGVAATSRAAPDHISRRPEGKSSRRVAAATDARDEAVEREGRRGGSWTHARLCARLSFFFLFVLSSASFNPLHATLGDLFAPPRQQQKRKTRSRRGENGKRKTYRLSIPENMTAKKRRKWSLAGRRPSRSFHSRRPRLRSSPSSTSSFVVLLAPSCARFGGTPEAFSLFFLLSFLPSRGVNV